MQEPALIGCNALARMRRSTLPTPMGAASEAYHHDMFIHSNKIMTWRKHFANMQKLAQHAPVNLHDAAAHAARPHTTATVTAKSQTGRRTATSASPLPRPTLHLRRPTAPTQPARQTKPEGPLSNRTLRQCNLMTNTSGNFQQRVSIIT